MPQLQRSLIRWALKTEIWLSLAFARLLVRFVPYSRWRGLIGSLDGREETGEAGTLTLRDVDRASDIGRLIVRTARSTWFEAVCLPQAMAGRWMLARRGIPSQIYLGTTRDGPDKELRFHAWLMAGEQCVTGAEERERFIAFSRSDRGNSRD